MEDSVKLAADWAKMVPLPTGYRRWTEETKQKPQLFNSFDQLPVKPDLLNWIFKLTGWLKWMSEALRDYKSKMTLHLTWQLQKQIQTLPVGSHQVKIQPVVTLA